MINFKNFNQNLKTEQKTKIVNNIKNVNKDENNVPFLSVNNYIGDITQHKLLKKMKMNSSKGSIH